MKTLFFEGAGCDYKPDDKSDVGNYRIRTAIKNNKDELIYIEMGRTSRYILTASNGRKLVKPVLTSEWALYVDFQFRITGDHNDCNINNIKIDWEDCRDNYNYTKTDILKYVNDKFDCDFDNMIVLEYFDGYFVHAGKSDSYNIMNDFIYNPERTAARREAYDKIDAEYKSILHEKYSKIGYYSMDDNSITIRCYASNESMLKYGLDPDNRIVNIPIIY